MDSIAKRSNLLLLRGVYVSDFTISIVQEVVVPQQQCIAWTDMPKQFTGVDTWPQFSNLQCWTCDQKPADYPKFIPLNPEQGMNERGQPIDICDVFGHFHTWHCAIDYVNKEFAPERRDDARKAISLFESKFSGKYKLIIRSAYPKTEMKQYCGNSGLTPEQWNKKLLALDTDYALTQYKIEHFNDAD